MKAKSRLKALPERKLDIFLPAKSLKGLTQAKSQLAVLPELKPGKISSWEITQIFSCICLKSLDTVDTMDTVDTVTT